LRAFMDGEDLTSLAEENQVELAPDPRAQQMEELLLVPLDLEDYGQFAVIAETPNDDLESVVAFLSNSEDIISDLQELLTAQGFITGYGRLLGSGESDDTGLVVVSQALLFDSAEGAAAFATGSTDLDLGAQAGNAHDAAVGDGARAFCRQRANQHWDCEVRFSRDNVFGGVAVLNFLVEADGLAAATDLALVMDQLITARP
jgi:hypothetical protein